MTLISLLMWISATASGQSPKINDYVISGYYRSNDFAYFASANCSTVFYHPLSYRYRADLSSSITYRNKAQKLIVFDATQSEPSEIEKIDVLVDSGIWANCKAKSVTFYPYPAVWISFLYDGQRAHSLSESRWAVDFIKGSESKEVETDHVLPKPHFVFKTIQKKVLRSVALSAKYSASAEFLQKFWTENRCVTKELGTLLGKNKSNHCYESPQVKQHLSRAEPQGIVSFDILSDRHSSPRILEMQHILLQRWAKSSHAWMQRYKMNDTLNVTFGELTKNENGSYYDKAVDEVMVEESYQAPSHINWNNN